MTWTHGWTGPRHLPAGPVGPASRWAATANDEVGQTTYPVNWGRLEREGREESEWQSYNEKKRTRGVEWKKGSGVPR